MGTTNAARNSKIPDISKIKPVSQAPNLINQVAVVKKKKKTSGRMKEHKNLRQ
jgi:hypothetical protein